MLGSVFVLIMIGLVMVLNASSVRAYTVTGDSYFYLKSQLMWVAIALVPMFFFSRVNYRRLVDGSKYFLGFVVLLLLLIHVPGVGREANGASRAISLGPFGFQPSELAKLAVILYMSGVVSAGRTALMDLKRLLGPGLVVLIIMGLVLFQPDLGTTIIIALSALFVLFIGGMNMRHIAGVAATSGLAGLYFAFSEPYRRDRLFSFLNPSATAKKESYQVVESIIGLGSGGPTGVGLGMSRQKFFYLPESHTDFIFAIIGEELGFIGCLFVLFTFGVLVYSGIKIAFNAKDHLGKLLGASIVASIAGQALINLGAVTGLLPVTGEPLPLVSYGGSSLIVTMSMLGILMNIASQDRRDRSNKPNEGNNKRGRDGRSRLSRARSLKLVVSR